MQRWDKDHLDEDAKSQTSGAGHFPVSEYRFLFASVPDPCLVLDSELRIVEVNRAYLFATNIEQTVR